MRHVLSFLVGSIYLGVMGWTNWLGMPSWAAKVVLVFAGIGFMISLQIFEKEMRGTDGIEP